MKEREKSERNSTNQWPKYKKLRFFYKIIYKKREDLNVLHGESAKVIRIVRLFASRSIGTFLR